MQILQTKHNRSAWSGHGSLTGRLMKPACTLTVLGVLSLSAIAGQLSGQKLMTNGDFSFSYSGIPGGNYIADATDKLSPPAAWTSVLTNKADSYGQVGFTHTPTAPQQFYRVHSDAAPLPLVYDVENTGKNFPPPPLPNIGSLPQIQPLPDPFCWANDPVNSNNTRSTNAEDWQRRRAEIKAQIEYYEIGTKPAVDMPTQVTASYSGSVNPGGTGTLNVMVTANGHQLALACPVSIPAGATAPYPVVIGMNSPNGGLTASDFSSRGIATVTFVHNQVTTYNSPQNTDPYYQLYGPTLNISSTGQYSAWAWGVSRIIDGLSLVTNTLPIDLKHICVTGCSYAGKMALFAGALDERIALTVAQESGGGGDTAWRYSNTEPSGSVEALSQTSHDWFKESMFNFGGNNVSFLPEDHHELMAMCAPRALYCTANTDYTWLSNPSAYVCGQACARIYQTLGIRDRFGFNVDGSHTHCFFPSDQEPDLAYFLDKFMKGQTNLSQNIAVFPASYATSIDYGRWTQWWGTTNAAFPATPINYTATYEAECAVVGSAWDTLTDSAASNGKYVTVKAGIQSIANAPTDSTNLVIIPIFVPSAGTYSIFARCNDATADDDSFWIKMDSGSFTMLNGLTTSGWQWVSFGSYALTSGPHLFTIGYREDGAKLDKISVSDNAFAPSGMGATAATLCP